ncbi:carboxymuconolactone decarboxylase family protein [Bradyrhizobium sp.]|jgi:AhpD family alkylhydroperoxidase|uniref:carboxymuconolactone decarboxylase family protein n=1 Tax=Bradyrhizobium sp. TaxID=376 RepID=UPI003D0AAE53
MPMLDWNTYRQQLMARVGEIAKISPDTIKGYQTLSAAGQKTNLLGPKIRELISLAVAVTVRCDGCITVHTEAAARHGASREEIAEALAVATAVNAGASIVYSTRVLDAYQQVTQRQPA